MRFHQARHYRKGGNTPVSRVVLHSMEAPEKGDTAEAIAAYFARGTVVASAHYCVDANSEVQCVAETDVAYHAPPNSRSIGIEHAGYARQTLSQWQDDYSIAMLRRSVRLCADICRRLDIPAVWLHPEDLNDGKRGITSHHNVSLAFRQSSHTDPGPAFPARWYVSEVQALLAGTAEEDDVTEDDRAAIAAAAMYAKAALDNTLLIAQAIAKLDADIPNNIDAELDEIRRNVRKAVEGTGGTPEQ